MNILVLLEKNPFVDSTAQNNRFLALAEGLKSNGCNLYLYFVGGYSTVNEKKKFGINGSYNNFNYRYLITETKQFYIKRKILDKFYNHKKVARKVYKELFLKHFDYIWFGVSQNLTLIGYHLIKLGIETKILHERSEFSWISLNKKQIHEVYLREFLPKVDVFAVMTKTLEDYYADYLNPNSTIIHLPMTVDFGRFKSVNTDNNLKKPYIGYCGTMYNMKDGVDILIQSFINIMHEFPQYSLYLAGPLIPEKDYLIQKELVKKNNADHRILHLGNLSKEAIPAFLSNADVLAMARPASKQAEGGFPTKLGEYLATAKPVCLTNIGETGLYLKDKTSAFFAEPDSIVSFTQTLRNCLSSKNARQVGYNGKDVAIQNFNKDKQAATLYKVLLKNLKK